MFEKCNRLHRWNTIAEKNSSVMSLVRVTSPEFPDFLSGPLSHKAGVNDFRGTLNQKRDTLLKKAFCLADLQSPCIYPLLKSSMTFGENDIFLEVWSWWGQVIYIGQDYMG